MFKIAACQPWQNPVETVREIGEKPPGELNAPSEARCDSSLSQDAGERVIPGGGRGGRRGGGGGGEGGGEREGGGRARVMAIRLPLPGG